MKKLAVAALVILVLVIGAAVAYDRGAGVLTIGLLGLVAGAGTLAAIDANQKVRRQQRHFSRWQKASERRMSVVEEELLRRGAHVEAATQDDVLGTVRLMQEQYLGRLDRARGELEQAAAALRGAAGTTRPE
ncbi:hypothetical protein [Georgenia satyanarayanai]|uniref:hypothetical protein n=1 Tax=Georgenia satyanarayanai TaxID=860221 RepID=UPI001264B7DB|nr:hypothetical protein [Georgenia satyanarayanai]